MVKFKALDMEGWRQFASVQIEFHERATIITGANGSGKTTLLNILSQHFGWSPAFIGTLRIDSRGARRYFSGFFNDLGEGNADVGRLTYDGWSCGFSAGTHGGCFVSGSNSAAESNSRDLRNFTSSGIYISGCGADTH